MNRYINLQNEKSTIKYMVTFRTVWIMIGTILVYASMSYLLTLKLPTYIISQIILSMFGKFFFLYYVFLHSEIIFIFSIQISLFECNGLNSRRRIGSYKKAF